MIFGFLIVIVFTTFMELASEVVVLLDEYKLLDELLDELLEELLDVVEEVDLLVLLTDLAVMTIIASNSVSLEELELEDFSSSSPDFFLELVELELLELELLDFLTLFDFEESLLLDLWESDKSILSPPEIVELVELELLDFSTLLLDL